MKLHLWDFDGTLIDSPMDTPANRKLYEKAHGIPWIIDKNLSVSLSKKLKRPIGMRRGWFGRPETLEPPLVPDPAPESLFIQKLCNEFLASKSDPDTMTVILTGRHAGLKRHVLRILDDGKLVKCERRTDQNGRMWIDVVDPDVQVYCLGEDGPAKPDTAKPGETLTWKLWIINQFQKLYPFTKVEIWEDRAAHVEAFEKVAEVHFVAEILAERN
jgi:hypothetical protein